MRSNASHFNVLWDYCFDVLSRQQTASLAPYPCVISGWWNHFVNPNRWVTGRFYTSGENEIGDSLDWNPQRWTYGRLAIKGETIFKIKPL